MFDRSTLISYVLILPIILLALSIHETAHGYVASKLGDPTAKSLGRLTLNPLHHIDIFGFLCMLFFHFGWAKPVPVNTRYFKKPRRDMALTSAAGPAANILLALIFAALLRIEILLVDSFSRRICLRCFRVQRPAPPSICFRYSTIFCIWAFSSTSVSPFSISFRSRRLTDRVWPTFFCRKSSISA